MQVTLQVIEGPCCGQQFEFQHHDTFVVGRGRQAHFKLPPKDPYFSRIHFLVEVNPPLCRLVDMSSTNGTFVNGQKVAVVDLCDGDRISGGDTVFQVSIAAAETTEPTTQHLSPTVDVKTPGAVEPLAETATFAAPSLPETFTFVAPREHGNGASPCRLCGGAQTSPAAMPYCDSCERSMAEAEQWITGYRIVRKLGQGGMGVVYLAWSEVIGTAVALKTISPAANAGSSETARFLREARLLRELDHPYVVAFRDEGESQGRLYFIMDYVPGVDARNLARTERSLPVGRIVRLVCQMLQALDYAHAKGVVHRDIKPSNLLVADPGPNESVRLTDFGLARIYQQSCLSGFTVTGGVSQSGEFGGSMPYIAPEQITNFRAARPVSDIYSAGATLYRLLTGRNVHDFPQRAEQQILMILQAAPIPIERRRKDLPRELAEAINRSIRPDAASRFQSAREMLAALRPFSH